jgi:hypothetical protein
MSQDQDAPDTKRAKPRNMNVPRDLFAEMREALRDVGQDAIRDDRSLHDETIDKVHAALRKLDAWQDAKVLS